jgi:amino acid adenylation domain-containing protein
MSDPVEADPAAKQAAADEAGRRYWSGVLQAGGLSPVPRWTIDPVPGVAEHRAPLDEELVAALDRRAAELDRPLGSLLLTAHARVLSDLSGDREIVTGYVPCDRGPALPCRLDVAVGSWRELVHESARREAEMLSHRDFPVDELRRELGSSEPAFETVYDPAFENVVESTADSAVVVLRVGFSRTGPRMLLRLEYRTDLIDAACASRIAGYHLTALGLIASDPDAAHGTQSLLSDEEIRCQLDGLAGRHRALPDRRFHELFQDRVAAHPERVAAVCGDRRWTYRQLDSRANRLGHALLARGLRPEDVVAVVSERTLDWMAAVLAVFKAGGAYLPVEPHFPAARIAAMLGRARCGLVLAGTDCAATLDEALTGLPDVRTLTFDEAYREDHPDHTLDVRVGADQLAYVYFTSGSTGEPKGAMCEHAGFLNHLFAKIDDLGIGEGHVVAQTAPQCFDISLWQLVSALLVGGRTHLIEQQVVLDVQRFVGTLLDGRVNVVQVVPSYLEVLLAHLEQNPRALPDLRCVSATGEALKKALVVRWFAAQPDVTLVNAYGLTETSDDTNHEVMTRAPQGGRVPLGRPVNNVRIYVVDENLSPVPLGAPGLICFSGVCVGRGYINDPVRTAQAYLTDPYRPGERLYRGGDYGRWRPDGALEFLGRRDDQVKISGFRIEIGDVENVLLRVPGVRDGAVVVAGRADGARRLVAFYTAHRPIGDDLLRDRLGESLPAYMVPAAYHRRESLPLTVNGKVDTRRLTAEAEQSGPAEAAHDAPVTPTELRLAAAWATVLGIAPERIGRHDHFFDRGGTSLSAVRLAITLDRAVSLRDLALHPVLSDLARAVDDRAVDDRAVDDRAVE